jgi:hypothetical protein
MPNRNRTCPFKALDLDVPHLSLQQKPDKLSRCSDNKERHKDPF